MTCSQRQLAKTAGMAVNDVHKALDALVDMEVLIQEERGKYRVHPSAMWRGELDRNSSPTPFLMRSTGQFAAEIEPLKAKMRC